MRPVAAVFDMDGLMIDSEPLSQQTWASILADFGYTLDEETIARMTGRRTVESAQIVLAKYSLPFTALELAAEKRRRWDARWIRGVPAKPGLFMLEAELKRRGLRWAVATSSPRDYAEGILKQLGLHARCQAVAAGDEVARGKPDPEIYLLAAERLGAPARLCLAFEDSLPGVTAARAAGMRVIAVPDGTADPHRYAHADHVFPSLTAVAEELDVLLQNGA
jgi:HAD superfamily hydrolase (TIGR01509 family)